jgi:hypothetical protein
MKKLTIILSAVVALASMNLYAEGGSDRVIERAKYLQERK